MDYRYIGQSSLHGKTRDARVCKTTFANLDHLSLADVRRHTELVHRFWRTVAENRALPEGEASELSRLTARRHIPIYEDRSPPNKGAA